MHTDTLTPPTRRPDTDQESTPTVRRRRPDRISRLELAVGGIVAAVLAVLVIIEPGILEAPFENSTTLIFTLGGTVLAALAFGAMLWLRVPPIVRVIVLVVPFALVNWWLLSPHFIDDVVNDEFSTSISAQLADAPAAAAPAVGAAEADVTEPGADATNPVGSSEQPSNDAEVEQPAAEARPAGPAGPVLVGAGQFVGLAGHDGVGDAGIFENPDGSRTLRFENFDIDNGPDLKVYLVPGADQTDLAPGSIDLGELKGNVGDQNYTIGADVDIPPGTYTVLVWCEAFSVEFVGATITA